MIDRKQREYWQRERDRRGLAPGRPDFGRSGLMARLGEPRLLVTVLPSDPLRPAVEFDDFEFADLVLPQSFKGQTANGVSMLAYVASTSDSLVRYAKPGDQSASWRAFVALRCDGGVEVGMGSGARFEFGNDTPLSGVGAYRLFVLVHAVRVAIATQARLCTKLGSDDLSPFEIVVVVPGAKDTVLTAFAEGWGRPEHDFEVPSCLEEDLMVRMEVETWPIDPGEQEQLLFRVASRICASFNIHEPRFLPRVGGGYGPLSPQYA